MAENRKIVPNGDFKEAVCIDGGRVYDSCCSRDCLEDLRVYFSPEGQALINDAVNVRCRGAEVVNIYIDVAPVHLNRGFYSCDLTYYFAIRFDVYSAASQQPEQVEGLALFSKKVILYGSEGKVKVFNNKQPFDSQSDTASNPRNNMPKCVVSCVEPLSLGARLSDATANPDIVVIPQSVLDRIGGEIVIPTEPGSKMILVTLGMFTVVQLVRNVQMLIPVYDFCIPEKECENATDDPCNVFSRLSFPMEDFFPQRNAELPNNFSDQ